MNVNNFLAAAQDFSELKYRQEPYNSRNWGNGLHSLCSYQGKLKPAVAHFLVNNFTNPGESVLDPLSGAGTIPLEALISGRRPVANDLQELAFILSTAKVGVPDQEILENEFELFISYVQQNADRQEINHNPIVEFGMNGKISDYFHPNNLKEILAAREFISSNLDQLGVERAIVFSSFLHILHGNRPYALSRNSHPVTPFKPGGDFIYKDMKTRLATKIYKSFDAYKSFETEETIFGAATLGSFEKLSLFSQIDAVITSPPFAASTRFYVSNWMRLWATGWNPEDFKTNKEKFIEEKQKNSYSVYYDFFESANTWLKPGGKLILHLGKTSKSDMAEALIPLSANYFDLVLAFDESVAGAEKFGIKDQGATATHQFVFLQKNS